MAGSPRAEGEGDEGETRAGRVPVWKVSAPARGHPLFSSFPGGRLWGCVALSMNTEQPAWGLLPHSHLAP